MSQFESRLKKLESSLRSKNGRVIILDEMTDEPESYFQMNGERFLIPPKENVEEFVKGKIKNIRGVRICGLYLSSIQ